MRRRHSYTRMDTAWRLRDIGGPDLAIRYLELSEQSQRRSNAEREQAAPTARETPRRSVIVNEVRLSDDEVNTLERAVGSTVRDGDYWYDRACGAWGMKGGPCAGFIRPGIALGGPLRRDASQGNTGVFVNGRELHVVDVIALQRLGPVFPGRYWVDGLGNFGIEGGPRMGNLAAAGQMTSGGAWTVDSRFGTVGGDGSGFMFFNDGKTFWST